jgi:hypothetical protein
MRRPIPNAATSLIGCRGAIQVFHGILRLSGGATHMPSMARWAPRVQIAALSCQPRSRFCSPLEILTTPTIAAPAASAAWRPFSPRRYGCATGTACAPYISRREGKDHGNDPHHRRTALFVRGRRVLLEQATRVIVGLERTRGPVSPFHNLGQRCGGPLPAESTPHLPSSGPIPAASGRPGAYTDRQVVSLPRYVRLLSLCVLGLIGLLSLGVGGVVLVQGYVFRASP